MERETPPLGVVGDVALGVALVAAVAAREAARAVGRTAPALRSRLVRLALRPPGLPERISPGALISALAERGREARGQMVDAGVSAGRAGVPVLVDAVLNQLDLTAIARERVDLDALAARLDVDQVIARADLDSVVQRIDVDAIARTLDVAAIVDRVDVNEIAERVDLDAITARLDLIGLAEYVVDGIDLPGIIRESSGSMASEAVRGVRMQGLEADQAVSRVVDRWLLRRRERDTNAPTSASGSDGAPILPGQGGARMPHDRGAGEDPP